MSIKFRCGECEFGIKVPDSAAGRAVKCPQCGARVKVPSGGAAPSRSKTKAKAGTGKRRKQEEAPGSDAFLDNLDLDRLIDTSVQLCQKCATEIPEGETACPNCGFDPEQLTAAGRKRQKMSSQGIDPATFYETVFKNSFGFAFGHIGQIFKTGFLMALFFLLAALCGYFLIWVATTPPFFFYSVLTLVAAMIPLGWLQVQHLEIMKLTLQKKDQIKKIPFDFALNGMYGLKFVFWVLIYGLPFWIVFGGLGILLNNMEVAFGLTIGICLALTAILLFSPQAQAHLCMPVEQPAWFFPKIAPTLNVSFVPGLVWALLFLLVNLPIIGIAAGTAYLSGEQVQEFVHARRLEGQARRGEILLKLAEGASSEAMKEELLAEGNELSKIEVPEKNWNSIWLPLGGGVLCCFLLGFSSLVVARANGLFTLNLKKGLNLISQTKEVVWLNKQKEDKVRTRRTTIPAPPLKRFGAYVVDGMIVNIVNGLLAFIVYQLMIIIYDTAGIDAQTGHLWPIFLGVYSLLTLLVAGFYFANLEAGEDQATPMKKALGLYVCDDEYRPISTGQSILRFVCFMIFSALTASLSNLLCLFREDRKTLHDLLTGTQVRADKPVAPPKAD